MLARRRWRGAALVEFALIVPLLIFLLLGILEFGILVMHRLTLEQAAREGSRLAAVRATTATIQQRITNAAPTITNKQEMQVSLKYSTDNGASFGYTLGNSGSENNAPPGSLVQVGITCPHHLVTGSFFAWLPGVANNAVPLHVAVVMRRE
jgi:Flp pilus assembly protein TadG